MGCNLGQPRTLNPELPTEKARGNPTYTTEPPKGSVITYRGQGWEGLKTGEWAPSLPCLPLHPVTAPEGLRMGGREAVPRMGRHSPLGARPQVSVLGEGGGHRSPAEAVSPRRGTLQGAAERPGCHGELERMSKGPGAGRAGGQNICFNHPGQDGGPEAREDGTWPQTPTL